PRRPPMGSRRPARSALPGAARPERCAGTPVHSGAVSSSESGADPLVEATRRLEEGEEVVLATAVRTDGSPPCRPGQKLLLGPGGPLAGTLGCSEFDASAVDQTAALLAAGEPALQTFTHDLGSVEVYLEP